MKKLIYIVFLLAFLYHYSFARGITNEELASYFKDFIDEYPVLKWSGFFSMSAPSRAGNSDYINATYAINSDIAGIANLNTNTILSGESAFTSDISGVSSIANNAFTNANLKTNLSAPQQSVQKSGLHISNCVYNECEISYNDYTDYKSGFAPLPECYSAQKLEVIDATHARVGDAALRIIDDKLQIVGSISFTCDDSIIAQNLERVGVSHDFENESYEITLRDVTLNAHFNYPINLNCVQRVRFSEEQLCVEPFLSDSYSFNQFFIFLAARAPQSFRFPNNIYINYRKMQSEISVCELSKYRIDCIYAALGRFESKIKNNLIINETPQVSVHYKLMR